MSQSGGFVEYEKRTYGVSWYVEVDATSEEEAIAKARSFLAPKYRKNWEPLNVDEIDPEIEGSPTEHLGRTP